MNVDQATGAIVATVEPPEYLTLKVQFLSLALEFQQKGYALIEKTIQALETLGEFYPTWLEDVCKVTNQETKTLHSQACRFKKAIDEGWFRAELTPQHHAEVDNKKLKVDDRSELLDKAIMHGWTTPQLREEVKNCLGVCPQTDSGLTDLQLYQERCRVMAELLEKILQSVELPDDLKAEIEKELTK